MAEENIFSNAESSNTSITCIRNASTRDPTSPYFLQTLDNPGVTLVSCPLTVDNYHMWRRAMTDALNAKNKFCFVYESLSKPDASDLDSQGWVTCNSMVLSWIFNSIATDLLSSVAYAETAREMWLDLEEGFSQGNAPRINQLKRELVLTTQENLSVAAYFTKLKGIWDEPGSYSTMPNCTCGAAKEFTQEREQEKVHQFLLDLSDAFNTVRSQILSTEPLLTLNKAYALMARDEKQQTLLASRTIPVEAAALHVHNNNSPMPKTSSRYQCDHCHQTGHNKDRCYELTG